MENKDKNMQSDEQEINPQSPVEKSAEEVLSVSGSAARIAARHWSRAG